MKLRVLKGVLTSLENHAANRARWEMGSRNPRVKGPFSGAFLEKLSELQLSQPCFEKGLAGRGGWREEILQRPEIQASFLYHFSYAPLGEGRHISKELFGSFWAVCLSPTPSRQPLFETSETHNHSCTRVRGPPRALHVLR